MSIETLYRVQCGGWCFRYLPDTALRATLEDMAVTDIVHYADTFSSFSDAYNEAVRRGWSAYPLVCPDCAAALKDALYDLGRQDEKVQRVEVRPEGHTEEDGRGLPEGSEGPE